MSTSSRCPRLLLALLLAGVAVPTAGCGRDGRARPTDAPKGTSMDDTLRNLDQHPDATISIVQGTEHFKQGQVTLRIRGSGVVEVEQRRAGETRPYARTLPPARIAELGRALAASHAGSPRTTTLPREPGDTPLVVRVDGAGAPFVAELWSGDRYRDRELDAILRLADAVIHEVTGGALGQPAP